MEEEVAADEVDEVVHKGPDKKGRVLWVVSHIPPLIVRESVSSLAIRCRVDLSGIRTRVDLSGIETYERTV